MLPVLVLTHATCPPPEYIADLLQKLELPFEQACFNQESVPELDPQRASALVIMGGPGNVSQPTEWMRAEIELIRNAHDQGVPVLGICLGAQLLCQALDGGVHPGADLEVGWHRVEVLEEGLSYPGFDRAGAGFEVFHWHAHVCDPPKGARVLAASACTPVQAFSLGAHLALQFHPEMTAATIRELIETYPEDLEPASACVQDALGILDGIEDKTQRAFKVADQLLSPWFARLKAGAG